MTKPSHIQEDRIKLRLLRGECHPDRGKSSSWGGVSVWLRRCPFPIDVIAARVVAEAVLSSYPIHSPQTRLASQLDREKRSALQNTTERCANIRAQKEKHWVATVHNTVRKSCRTGRRSQVSSCSAFAPPSGPHPTSSRQPPLRTHQTETRRSQHPPQLGLLQMHRASPAHRR